MSEPGGMPSQSRRSAPKPWHPMAAALIASSAYLAVLYVAILGVTSGEFSYALDDSYIHLALAKTLSSTGVWGVTPHEAAAASSSPLWTLLLAGGMQLFGNQLILPLALTSLCALGTILAVDRWLNRFTSNGWYRAGASVIIALGLPVSLLVFLGMEHQLHAMLAILFLTALLDSQRLPSKHLTLWLFGLGFLLTLTRYESAFLFVVPFVAGLRRNRVDWLAPMAGAALAVVGFGLYSKSIGLPFLPNTLLLKSDAAAGGNLMGAAYWAGQRFLSNAKDSAVLLPLLGAIVAIPLLWKQLRGLKLVFFTFVGGLLLHLLFSLTRTGYGRYEAYLIAALGAVFAAAAACALAQREWRSFAGGAVFGLTLLVARTIPGHVFVPTASKNIFEQQVQMAKFLRDSYPGASVAVLDVGAISYFADVRVLDLCGLASNDVRAARFEHRFNSKCIADLTMQHQVEVAIVAPAFLIPEQMPENMFQVATWKISDKVATYSDEVTFFAPKGHVGKLMQAIIEFDDKLPQSVEVRLIAETLPIAREELGIEPGKPQK